MKNFLKTLYFILKYKKKNVRFSKKCKIAWGATFEGANFLGEQSIFSGYMGFGTYIGANSSLNAKIGRYTSIASFVRTVNGFHPTQEIVSTHPFFYSNKNCVGLKALETPIFNEHRKADENKKYDVIIGNDVWIGQGVTLIAGVKIGDGSVIGTGAVVTKDVEPYTIVGGVPAKEIRKRFSEDEIDFLLKFNWWNKGHEWIEMNRDEFQNIQNFMLKVGDRNESV